jgi:hypothetical protein
MAISNAVNLANFSSGDTLIVDSVNDRVGIASTVPTTTLDVNGTVKATTFEGSGANLTNLTGVVNSVIAGDNISVSSPTGDVTITGLANTSIINADSLNVTGITTVTTLNATTVSIAGTLSYEDVTNVSATGIITANNGISVPSGGIVVTGVVTATSFVGNGANLTNLNIPASFNELDSTLFS